MSIDVNIILCVLLTFCVSTVLCPLLIPVLIRLRVGQTERIEGVQSHLKKAGTPTMGGIAILPCVLAVSAFYVPNHPRVFPVLMLMVLFGAIGFTDDYLKVVKRRSDGLLPRQKLVCQIAVTTLFIIYTWLSDPSRLDWRLPFSGGVILSGTWFRFFSTLVAYFAVIGTVNGVNFTDGLDGLASSVTAVVAVFFVWCSLATDGGVELVCASVFGALLAFLLFNVHPAKVFMGDTGSLALGGFVVGVSYELQMPVFLLVVGFVYLAEVVSVMIQVTYFRKTGGKRFFKMAPIHHHFELSGWSETRVVGVFTIVTILLCLIALIHF